MTPPSPPENGRTSPELQELWARVELSVAEERGPRAWLRSRSTAVRTLLVCAFVVVLGVVHFAWARRSDWSPDAGVHAGLALGLAALGVVLCVRVTLAPLARPQSAVRALAAGMFLLLPLLTGLLPALRLGALDSGPATASFAPTAGCFAYGTAVAASVCAALWWVDRGGQTALSWRVPAVVGAGLVAHVVLQIHCANDDPAHLLLGHASIGIVWVVVAVALRALSLSKS
jgi:hypothetical protein